MFDLNRLKDMKRIESNGYYEYYIPEHHLANKNGIVYEHQIIAEHVIGRELKEGEVVHHKDKNKSNNSPDNLIVFKTSSDHSAYHKGRDIIKDGDVYVAIDKGKDSKVNDCPICGGEKYAQASMCLNCYKKMVSKNQPTKEELYCMLRDNSMCAIGRKFNVSDNAVRKWCKKYGLPYNRNDIIKFREKEFGIIKQTKEKQEPTKPKPVIMYDLNDNYIVRFESLGMAAQFILNNNLSNGNKSGIRTHIANVCNGDRHIAYNHKWKYA